MRSKAIVVLGLGEAGRLFASGLAAEGATIRGFDPYVDARGAGINQYDDLGMALDGAAAVLSLVGAGAAAAVAEQAAAHLPAGSLYADLNTASPGAKSAIGRGLEARGVDFADVAVLAPVPRAGHRTPLLTSGPGADLLAEILRSFGANIESIGGAAGEAAARKLLRSVFMKGLAALVLESTTAGEAAGHGDWIRAQISSELGPGGGALVERLITGTRTHAKRRQHEVHDALDYLKELESPAWITEAALKWISSLSTDGIIK